VVALFSLDFECYPSLEKGHQRPRLCLITRYIDSVPYAVQSLEANDAANKFAMTAHKELPRRRPGSYSELPRRRPSRYGAT
jgi:hypothetical protein